MSGNISRQHERHQRPVGDGVPSLLNDERLKSGAVTLHCLEQLLPDTFV